MARLKNNPILLNLAELRRLAVMIGAGQVKLFLFSHDAYLHYLPPESYSPETLGDFRLFQISIPTEGILFVAVFQKKPGDLHFPDHVTP